MEFFGLAFIAVFIPLVFKHPQIVVGSVVNFALIFAAINVRGVHKMLPLIVLPSISALAYGVLFGPFTIFLIYMLPFIWIGNTTLVILFKYLYVSKRINYGITLIVVALIKAGFLFGCALLLVELAVVPEVFASAMGLIQLETAVIGGLFALTVNLTYKHYMSSFKKNSVTSCSS